VNPLLAHFEIRARQEKLPLRVASSVLAPHPITRGIDRATFKNAVGLECPPGASILKAGDDTVLAARDYGEGRVVVAATSPWFMPYGDVGEWWKRCERWGTGISPDQFPLGDLKEIEVPLLGNVIAWLGEPSPGQGAVRRLPDDFVKAHRAALEVQLQVRPREELSRILDAFVAASGPRREEALWLAGEAEKPMPWAHSWNSLIYGWLHDSPPTLDPRHFEELVRSYPGSALRPYAQWEIAEYARINLYYDAARNHELDDGRPLPIEGLSAAFAKVDAPKGSYAWAWARIRLGMIALQEGQPARALEHAQAVADVMEPGAEKLLALFLLGVCSEDLGKPDDAVRYYEFIRTLPTVMFPSERQDIAWAPIRLPSGGRRFFYWTRESGAQAQMFLEPLRKGGR
jgi:hypothetical protein